MADSLREQLLKSGIVKTTRNDKPSRHKKGGRKRHGDNAPVGATGDGEMDLAQAWAVRNRAETAERKRAKAEAEAEARARKERVQRLREVLQGKSLNKADAQQVRHFEYGGKIRRIYVDAAQLTALNEGRLGVVQVKGSHVLVTREVAEQVRAFAPGHVALLVDPDARNADDGVPDDLMW